MNDNKTNLLKRVLIFCVIITLVNLVIVGIAVLRNRAAEPNTEPESRVVVCAEPWETTA